MTKNNDFVTKTYLDKKLSSFKTELKDELKSELYEIKDEIVGEIKALREEFDTHQYSHVRINEEIEEHDKRITVLETATS
jgi:chromosome segregation ATPase